MVIKRRETKRKNEGYRVYITLPQPWGLVGPWQTGLNNKQQARAVEAWLYQIALTRPAVVDGIIAKKFSLRDAWVAQLRGTLDALVSGLSDPLLTEAVESYRPHCKDEGALSGLDQIIAYAPEGVRLSWLADNNIRTIYAKALANVNEKTGKAKPRKPNTVRRSTYRGICELLAYHLKDAGREAAMKDVPVPGEDDTRVVHTTPDEVAALVAACTPQFKWFVVAAIATAIDRGVLLRMTPRDIHADMLDVPDRKTKDRKRLLRVSGVAMMAFRMAAMGKKLDEPLWGWTEGSVRHQYDAARTKAGVPGLRFKDLRHVLPTLLAANGVDRREIQAYLGHAMGSKQTDRYITPSGDVAVLDAVTAVLFPTGLNLKVG